MSGHDAILLHVEALFLSSSDAARACGVSERTWRRMNRSGLVPAPICIGRRRLGSRAELERWAAAGAPPREEWERCRKDYLS